MKRNELIKLRKLVNIEIERRKRIKELLEQNLVKEYLKITNSNIKELDENNIQEILNNILKEFSISRTNGIYVCTYAYYLDWNVYYQETNYYSKSTDINSIDADYKIYADIESDKLIKAVKENKNNDKRPLISNFEKENIVLNPYNTHQNNNGFYEVKYNFFNSALKDGQEKAKKLILSKYPRL